MQTIISLFIALMLPLFAVLPQEREYPDWFLYPAKNPGIVTGFTYNKGRAVDHAAAVSCIYNGCILYGTVDFFNAENIDRAYKNSEYYYYYSEKCAGEYKKKLKPLQSLVLNVINMNRITAFTRDTAVKISGNMIKESALAVPDWKDKIYYEEGGWLYGVGVYTSSGSDNDAWITAEEKAVFTIVQNQMVKVSSYSETLNAGGKQKDHYQKIVRYTLAARLRKIEVVERFPDAGEKQYYVLVRVPAGGIKFLGDNFDMERGYKKHKMK